MAGEKQYWGNLDINALRKAITTDGFKVKNTIKYGEELEVYGLMYDDDNLSISCYDPISKTRIRIGKLIPSKSNGDNDIPF